jgi:hypothetical protein
MNEPEFSTIAVAHKNGIYSGQMALYALFGNGAL